MKDFSSPKSGETEKEKIYKEVDRHYQQWTFDNTQRRTRKNGWNDVTDAYWGKLPADWPYLNKVVDPRIRTSLIEKNARLLNAKLRGHLVPREGGDVLGARINNALIDYQWDSANDGRSMLEKWGSMDLDTRLYCSKFGLVKWKHEENSKKEVLFDGNEFRLLDIRDSGMDPSADHVRNAKWFQAREWAKVEDLDTISDNSIEPKFPGLKELKDKMSETQNRRDTAYENRVLALKGLMDHVGDDKSFPIVELVTEYRPDHWITFAPQFKVILRDIPNPYEHHKIPVVQLRYYSIQGDPLGESEVEPVLPIWKAIQATVCGYLDNMANHIRPPLKVIEGAARMETIVYGPDAQWLVDRQDAVMEMPSNGEAMKNFQSTYQALVSAFNTAMGDTSLGVSSVDVQARRKTATEIKNSEQQQNNRDQKNQTSLADALQDMMSMWLVNNKQFLFADQSKQEYILKILGSELFNYFKRAGLDQMVLPNESATAIHDIIMSHGGNMSDGDINGMVEAGKVPQHPVFLNPKEKNPSKLQFKPKMEVNQMGDGASLSIVPDDLEGSYDYIASVKSMSTGAQKELLDSRQKVLEMLTTNPNIIQMLAQEGVKPMLKDLFINTFEDLGMKDADRYFSSINGQDQAQGQAAAQTAGGAPAPTQAAQQQPKGPSESINFKDLPPDGQVQMAKQAGLNISTPMPKPQPSTPQAPTPQMPQGPQMPQANPMG